MHRSPLALTSRGSRIDALHYGSIAVVDPDGSILHSANDPCFPTYLRSSIKMIQALPVVISGAADRFGFTEKELAMTVASHSATREHVEVVEGMLEKLGLTVDDLRCGAHEPEDHEERDRVIRAEEKPTQLHNNCSGKHTGMLAVCIAKGWPLENYIDPGHPLQQWLLDLMAEYSRVPREQIAIGIDGCSLPAYYMPLCSAARIAAEFLRRSLENPDGPDSRVRNAVTAHPKMIDNDGEFDTELIRATGGRIFAKRGAMAILLMAAESDNGPLGIAIKMEDGNSKSLWPVAMQTLEALDLLKPEEIETLKKFRHPVQTNAAGLEVGEIVPEVKLEEQGVRG